MDQEGRTTAGNRDVVATLNDLIQTCKDGQAAYRSAADHVGDADLQALFDSFALQRNQFINDLQAAVRYFGGNPDADGNGSLQRGWVNLKARLTGGDEKAILAECARGEHAAVQNYEDALQEQLPAEVVPLMEYQYWQLREAFDRLQALEDGIRSTR